MCGGAIASPLEPIHNLTILTKNYLDFGRKKFRSLRRGGNHTLSSRSIFVSKLGNFVDMGDYEQALTASTRNVLFHRFLKGVHTGMFANLGQVRILFLQLLVNRTLFCVGHFLRMLFT